MTVLITRPSPFGERLAELLSSHGIESIHTPLIQFTEGRELTQLPEKIAQLTAGDLVFFVSQQAVSFAHQALLSHNLHWPENLNYFAIGKSTANSFHQLTNYQICYPKDREISEHLIKLPELQYVGGKKLLILRGNGGREFLAEQLAQRGAQVHFCECYQRKWIEYSLPNLICHWQEQGVNSIIITSAEILNHLYHLVDNSGKNWLLNCQLVVVSERIALLARQLGWRNIKIANNADNMSLLAALK